MPHYARYRDKRKMLWKAWAHWLRARADCQKNRLVKGLELPRDGGCKGARKEHCFLILSCGLQSERHLFLLGVEWAHWRGLGQLLLGEQGQSRESAGVLQGLEQVIGDASVSLIDFAEVFGLQLFLISFQKNSFQIPFKATLWLNWNIYPS